MPGLHYSGGDGAGHGQAKNDRAEVREQRRSRPGYIMGEPSLAEFRDVALLRGSEIGKSWRRSS